VAHDQDAVRDPQGDRQLLLDQQDRQAAPGDLLQEVGDLMHQLRRQPFGRLVDHDQRRIAHQGAADRQHLLLAARQHLAVYVRALAQIGKHLVHVVHRPAPGLAHVLDAEDQVLAGRQGRENVAVLGHVADALAGDDVRLEAGDLLAAEGDRAPRRHLAGDRLDGGRAADAVAAQKAYDLAFVDVERDALQDVALAVIGVQVLDPQHLSHRRSPDRLPAPAGRRESCRVCRWR
jgi:hypothetical protein